jgi:DNA-binding PadR family transcriptional regulator
MSLQEALAGLLSGGPAHGYELFSTLEGELGPAWETRQSHLYLTLSRMERDGIVSSRRIRQHALPDRQVFELTARGKAIADRWLATADAPSEMVVKLAVARLARPDLFEGLAAVIEDEIAGRLKTLRELSRVRQTGFQSQALALEIGHRQAEIRWLSSVRDETSAILAQPRAHKRRRAEEMGSEHLG